MIDRLRQMAMFAKTIDHGSFRGAAKELKISPSVVSHHISKLEEHLGVTLIYRSTRKLTLTRDGERLLAATRKMLGVVESELFDISGSAQEPSGELRITLPSVLSQSILSDAISSFMTMYPRVSLLADYSDTRKELISDGFDLAIRMSINAKDSLTTRKLFKVERRLVASTEYLNSQRVAVTPRDLQDWDWLLLSQVHARGIQFSHQTHSTQKIKPKARLISNDAHALFRLVSNGIGAAALPEFLSAKDVQTGTMQYVLPEWKLDDLHVYAEWPANATKHGLIFLLVNCLSEYGFESL
ncbi:MAG: LysR family transcriptional regulator [Litorimonas sp.]